MTSPDLTYVVSLYNRPLLLRACLASLAAQTHQDFEVIVTDNSTKREMISEHQHIVNNLGDDRFRYVRSQPHIDVSDCYWSAEYGASLARGKYLCFPCDDCYYLPQFGGKMLSAAARKSADLVDCHVLLGMEGTNPSVFPAVFTVKSSFIVRRDTFAKVGGFRGKPPRQGASCADRVLGEDVRAIGRATRIPLVLVVHN